jgi:hypothetical protein
MDAHNERTKYREFREELMAGIVASTMANWSMREVKEPLRPIDFMPSQSEKPVRRRINTSKVVANIRDWLQRMDAMGKVIVTNRPPAK